MSLPKKVKLPPDVVIEHNEGNVTATADYLSDEYGFCVVSLIVKNGIASDIVWDLSE